MAALVRLVVNVNKRSISADARAFFPNDLLGVDLLILNAPSKVKSQRDSNDNLLVKTLKVSQLTKQNKTLHRVQNNLVQSNTIQNFRHVIAYCYLPLLYLSHKKNIKCLGDAILLVAAQAGSISKM